MIRLNSNLHKHEGHSYSFGLNLVIVSRYSKCNLRLEIGLAFPQERPRLIYKNNPSRVALDGKNGGGEFSRK